eukprot:21510-Pelagococcus_subviridis.AAC.12
MDAAFHRNTDVAISIVPPKFATAPPRPARAPVAHPSTTHPRIDSSPPTAAAAAPPCVSDHPFLKTKFSNRSRPHFSSASPSIHLGASSSPHGEYPPLAVTVPSGVVTTVAAAPPAAPCAYPRFALILDAQFTSDGSPTANSLDSIKPSTTHRPVSGITNVAFDASIVQFS